MIRTHLRTFRPFLQSAVRPIQNAPGFEIWQSISRPGLIRRLGQRTSTKPNNNAAFRSSPGRSFHNTSRLRQSAEQTKTKKPEQESLGFSARMKKLSREYGWSAVGVYFALSVLDFPFCFLLVRVVGTDRIGAFEEFVVSNAKKVIPQSVRDKYNHYRNRGAGAGAGAGAEDHDEQQTAPVPAGWGVEEAEIRNKSEASLGTQLALAYAIHKSFIFLRVPLTAAVTPKVVKVLRSWGWDIGKRRVKKGVPDTN
ncbi:hypothetical protein GGS20DRAFT_583617 [Poronia punctata]|nr:hypothetical protein GGS20DRAFT_583617 [Poronia punctata]